MSSNHTNTIARLALTAWLLFQYGIGLSYYFNMVWAQALSFRPTNYEQCLHLSEWVGDTFAYQSPHSKHVSMLRISTSLKKHVKCVKRCENCMKTMWNKPSFHTLFHTVFTQLLLVMVWQASFIDLVNRQRQCLPWQYLFSVHSVFFSEMTTVHLKFFSLCSLPLWLNLEQVSVSLFHSGHPDIAMNLHKYHNTNVQVGIQHSSHQSAEGGTAFSR